MEVEEEEGSNLGLILAIVITLVIIIIAILVPVILFIKRRNKIRSDMAMGNLISVGETEGPPLPWKRLPSNPIT